MNVGMSMLIEEFTSKLREIKMDYLNEQVKVVLKKDIPKLVVHDRSYEDLKQGTVVQVRRWFAEELCRAKVATLADNPLDESSILQLEWKERNNPSDIQPLPPFFFFEVSNMLSMIEDKDRRDALFHRLVDIVSIRASKLVRLAMKGVRQDVEDKLTVHERFLYRLVGELVSSWLGEIKSSIKPRRDLDGGTG